MTKEQLDLYIDINNNGSRIANFIRKEKLPITKIDWLTDLDKIDLSVLRTRLICNMKQCHQTARIELEQLGESKIDDSNYNHYINMLGDPATNDLIEFIKQGNKIIPPIYLLALEYDGNTFKTNKLHKEKGLCDGGHRLFVSRLLGLTEIPVIVLEKIEIFIFPYDKWTFKYDNISLTVSSTDGKNEFNFDLCKMCVDHERTKIDTLAFSLS